MNLEELLTHENMEVINQFSFKVYEGPVLVLNSSDLDLTIETPEDEFGNRYFKVCVSDEETHLQVREEGTDLEKIMREALLEWRQEFTKISLANSVAVKTLRKLEDLKEKQETQ